MKKIFLLAIGIWATLNVSAQETSSFFDFGYASRYTFNDKYTVVSPADTFQISKVGQGNSHEILFIFFLPQNRPEFRVGFSGSLQKMSEGKFLLDPQDYRYYNYRIWDVTRVSGGLNFAFDELFSFPSDLQLGTNILWESNNLNLNYRNNGDSTPTKLDGSYSRLGTGISGRFIFSRSEDVDFLPKLEINAFSNLWFKKDIDQNNVSWGGNFSLNVYKLLDISDYYISPIIGASFNDDNPVGIGISPIISGGVVISAKYVRADLFKVCYQRKVYGQSLVPYTGIDGVFFSINVGALWQQ